MHINHLIIFFKIKCKKRNILPQNNVPIDSLINIANQTVSPPYRLISLKNSLEFVIPSDIRPIKLMAKAKRNGLREKYCFVYLTKASKDTPKG